MPEIYTLTLNPTLDRTMYLEGDVAVGGLNRAKGETVTTIGGKGTNVSCVLGIFGADSTALGFLGGENGKLFSRLYNEQIKTLQIKTDFTETAANTRMNIKVISRGNTATEFNESGGPVTSREYAALMDKIADGVRSAEFFFMGGSVPRGLEKSVYRDIINFGHDEGGCVRFVVDCDGEALRLCMENEIKPYMIKPNRFELEQLTGERFDLEGDFAAEKNRLMNGLNRLFADTGTEILCTLDRYGGAYCGREGSYFIPAPKVEVRGFTGAGDTFLAAFISVRKRYYVPRATGSDALSALRFAVYAASAKVTHPGTEFASAAEVEELAE